MSDEKLLNQNRWTRKVWAGFGIVLLLHFIWLALYGIGLLFFPGNSNFFLSAYLVIGISQLIYVAPLCIWFAFKDRSMLQGAALAALVTFLLNAACFGIVLFQFAG